MGGKGKNSQAFERKNKKGHVDKLTKVKELQASAQKIRLERLRTLQSHDIEKIQWHSAVRCVDIPGRKCESGGVVSVELEGGTAVIIRKKSSLIAAELVADRVASALGVRVARLHLLHPDSDEIQQLIEIAEYANPLPYLGGCHSTLGITEFVPGPSLDRAQDALISPTENFFAQIGRLCVLDVLLNNFDRIPLPLWQNEGNLTNVLVTSDSTVVGIDQHVNHIDAGPELDLYLKHIRSLVSHLVCKNAVQVDGYGDMHPDAIAARIRQAIHRNCLVELSENSLEMVLKGLRDGFLEVADSFNSGKLANATEDAIEHGKKVIQGRVMMDCVATVKRDADFVLQIAGEVAAVLRSKSAHTKSAHKHIRVVCGRLHC